MAKDLFDLIHHQDLTHHQDVGVFERVFQPHAVLYGVVDGQLPIRPRAILRQAVLARRPPVDLSIFCQVGTRGLNRMPPTLALVKMQRKIFGGVIQGYLNPSSPDGHTAGSGQWWVIAEIWGGFLTPEPRHQL